jgi:RNA polymerase sporulation-specific sigma factor
VRILGSHSLPRGGGRESNPPTGASRRTGFEDREGHQSPFASAADRRRSSGRKARVSRLNDHLTFIGVRVGAGCQWGILLRAWSEVAEDINRQDDAELVARARQGNDRALDALLSRYRNFARSKARSFFLVGADKEDVVQEGMIGLYKAIRDFDLEQQTPFRAFAELCVSRQILTAIKTANRNKHRPLNTSVSLDAPAHTEDLDHTVGDDLVAPAQLDPAEVVISAEEIAALRDNMRDRLTELEGSVLGLYMDGKSYEEIAGALGAHVKSIDNALQRIKRKIQRHIQDRDS